MRILVTGTAGFIGSFTAERLAERGDEVVGLDSINDYYDVNLKFGRLEKDGIERAAAESGELVKSKRYPNYRFIRMHLEDRAAMEGLFRREPFDAVCHLAAQAGVRYSLVNPYAYIESNILGFQNILESCRHNNVKHLVYASSSSVYGLNERTPFSTKDNVDHPVYPCTQRRRSRMNSWPTLTAIFTAYPPRG
jgi:UDP-glucuronate 4-epimerase